MLRFLANHVIETMYSAELRVIVMDVIVLITIQRAIQIIDNPDFLQIATPVIVLRILIGIARI
jgi:hypothetical protein